VSATGGASRIGARLRLAITASAVLLASLCFREGYPTPIYDSLGYYILSIVLRIQGLSAWPTDLRTYGYPLFVAIVTGFRDLPPEEVRLATFVAQLVVFLAVCHCVSRKLAAIFRSETLGVWAYGVGALNPVLLIHTTELLSDLVSAVLVQLCVALSWKVPEEDAAGGGVNRRVFLSFLCAGAAVAVRPANAVVVVALCAVWALRAGRWREPGLSGVVAALVGLIPPLVPQTIINYGLSGKLNPLLVAGLYGQQRVWGMGTIKYGTVLIDGRSPFLTYLNPFYAGDPGPRVFLLHHPLRYLATLGLHAFAMLDPDLPFTYVTDLRPGYRWPLGVLNAVLLYLALVGLLLGAWRALRRRKFDELEFVFLSTLVVGSAYLVLYLPVAVESRFGIPILSLATPLIVGAGWLWRFGGIGPAGKTAAALGLPVWLTGCVLLSAWISATQTDRFVPSPGIPSVPALRR
jgi:hypothetical protein